MVDRTCILVLLGLQIMWRNLIVAIVVATLKPEDNFLISAKISFQAGVTIFSVELARSV